MSWQILLFISIFFSSFTALFHRSLMKDKASDSRAQTIVFSGLVGIFSLVIALIRGFHFPDLSVLLPNFILMVAVMTLAPLLVFKSYKLSDASEVTIALSTQRLWTVLFAFIFLGELATFSKVVGTILILAGVGVISWKKHRLKITKGIALALVSGLLYGISFVNAFYILQSLDAPSFEVYATLLPALFLFLIQPHSIRKMKFYLTPSNGFKIAFVAIFDLLATLTLYFAYQVGNNASQISPLSATSLILTVIFAAIFLGERKDLLKKITGAIVVIVGSILIIQG